MKAKHQHFKTNMSLVLLLFALPLALAAASDAVFASDTITKIGFGSCAHQKHEQIIWQAVADARPDVFVMLGDNVYADTEDMEQMRQIYAQLAAKPGFQKVRQSTTMLATWDDHDYGKNDAGAEFPKKAEARQVFLEFWGRSNEINDPAREGIYSSWTGGPEGRRVQIILLDTRSFRSPLDQQKINGKKTYLPVRGEGATMLGETQWRWLEDRLREPADVRILASSIQVIPDEHRFEKWANLPEERDRLFQLLGKTGARNLIIISGDRHLAEISKLEGSPAGFPLYEVTSSALTMSGGGSGEEPNRYRIAGGSFRKNNFGLITINWSGSKPELLLEIRDEQGAVALSQPVTLATP